MRLPPIDQRNALISMSAPQTSEQSLVPPQLNTLQNIVMNSLNSSRLAIQRVEDVPSHIHPVRLLHLSDGSRLSLKTNPSGATPLLKSERLDLETEAHSLMILAKSGLPIPKVLTHDPVGKLLGSPFLLTNQLPGTKLATLLPHLSRPERMDIDRQLSDIETTMAQHLSPAFGPIAATYSGRGFKRWREAYKSMLGSVLKDGEDMFVNLPYAQIREMVAKAESSLDEVQEAQLVVLDLGDPENVLVNDQTKKVTGLIDFKKALWGDIDMVTGDASTSLRGLLYTCYHAVVVIVTCYYRPLKEGKELDARRTLATALAQLAAAHPSQ
ncbi:hypothetical protein MMC27_001923 [Xylographa pallens]|nr:hypothetical protein [Xylographa pallens]